MTKSDAQLSLDIDRILAQPAPPATKTNAQLNRDIADALESKSDPDKVKAYADKLDAKKDRLESRARKARGEASAAFGRARSAVAGIPMGQPILVGHHSEGRHRGALKKQDRAMRKGIEASDKAAEFASRAAAVGTAGISSDDPEAIKKLKIELNGLRLAQDQMKAGNAVIKRLADAGAETQITALRSLGISERAAQVAVRRDFGRNFNGFATGNNQANIRRVEKRIAELAAKESTPARASIKGTIEGLSFTLSENKEANRTQIEFSGKPSDALRDKLKRAAFKWAPSVGVWQRHMSNGAWYQATQALGVTP